MIAINIQKIHGDWKSGLALDFHTTSSTPIGYNAAGHMQYDTIRTEIAELLYQLKYKNNREAAKGIIEVAGNLVLKNVDMFDLLVPVPPSTNRSYQPVMVLAEGIAALANIPLVDCISKTRPTTQLKSISERDKRRELLDGLYIVDSRLIKGKNVLLFDDLYRSGSTMNEVTKVLLRQGEATNVHVLTITKTRSNQ